MSNFRQWYLRNQERITWAIIGFLLCDALFAFATGNYTGMILPLVIAYINYYFWNQDRSI